MILKLEILKVEILKDSTLISGVIEKNATWILLIQDEG